MGKRTNGNPAVTVMNIR